MALGLATVMPVAPRATVSAGNEALPYVLRLIFASVTGLAVLLVACGGSDAGEGSQTPSPSSPESATPLPDDDSAPPLLDDIRSGGSSSDEELLFSLALTEEDLPEGFTLDYQETTDLGDESLYVGRTGMYIGHFVNDQASQDELFSGDEPITSDVAVWLLRSTGVAIDFFREFQSATAADLVESTEKGAHIPGGPEFERFDVVEVEARKLPSPLGSDSIGLEFSEHTIDAVTGEEFVDFNVSIVFRVDRAVASVNFGTFGRSASIDSLTPLAERLQERLHAGLQGSESAGEGLEGYVVEVESVLSRLIHETERCSTDRSQPCLTAAFEVAYEDLGRLNPPDGSGLQAVHDELHRSTGDFRDVHRRSEVEPPTEDLLTDSLAATERFSAAVEGWTEQAENVE